jgi:hypothetical protein
VKEKIQSKRKTGGKRVAFLQDNARPHTAKTTMDDAVIQTDREWIRRQPQAFSEKGIRMLPERGKKCVDSGGEYVED